MKWQIQDILTHLDQTKFTGDATQWVEHVCIDSKKVKKNSAFVALKGTHHDGHKFVEEALQAGASVAIIEKDLNLNNTLVCENTQTTLAKMGVWARQKINHPVIGITGSSGKTTTKELLQHVLSAVGKTQSTQGNLNNHLGVPLTLLNFEVDADFSIVEMGMSAQGEIAFLSQMAQPQIGLITSVGPAHLEHFDGSLQKIAEAKGELFSSLKAQDTAIINADEPLIQALSTQAKKISYGFNEMADIRITQMSVSHHGTDFTLNYKNLNYVCHLPLVGRYHIQNAASVFAVACALNVDLHSVAKKFASFQVYQGRGQCSSFKHGFIIDDTYNANPSSVQASLETVSTQFKNLKKVAVLGDMLELGNTSSEWHFKVGEMAKQYGIDQIYVIGLEAINYLKGYGIQSSHLNKFHFATHLDLAKTLFQSLNPNESVAILFKGSRGMKMENVLQEFLNCVNKNLG